MNSIRRFPPAAFLAAATLLPGILAATLAAAVVAVGAAPACAQMLYLDVNGDGRGDADDVLNPRVTSVDVYLDTNHDATGREISCQLGPLDAAPPTPPIENDPLSICSYTIILAWTPGSGGSLSYGAWTDNMGFTVPAGGMQSGRMFWIGRAAPIFLGPGRYLLGSLAVKVTGTPVLRFLASTPLDKMAMTSFGSPCGGRDYDNTIKLGTDFEDARGTAPRETEASQTVWGTIRRLYR